MNDFSPWLTSIFISKLSLYIAYAMSVGGVSAILMIQRYKPQSLPFLSYATWGVILGLLFSSIDFFLQVGSFAESGIAGMWDQTYIEILWQSEAGMAFKLRLTGWLILLTLLIILRFNSALAKPVSLLYLGASLIIAASFTKIGHTAEQATWVRLALILHISIAMWWVGSLYPLRCWCHSFPLNTLQLLMHDFGKQASVWVVLLLIAGGGISYAIERDFDSILNSLHGNILLLKIALVAAILGLAAHHKFRLVPNLASRNSGVSLKLSIGTEIGLALVILIITAALSTLVGPA